MINWIKPNGNEITTNDEVATVAHCEAIGWTRADEEETILIEDMTKKELVALIEEYELDVETKGKVDEVRAAVLAAIAAAEDE